MAGQPDGSLLKAIGPANHARLRARLLAHAVGWCARAAHGDALMAESGEDLPRVLDGHAGPVYLVATDVPALGPAHLQAAWSDLDDGVLATLAPATDGHPFLVALAQPDAELLAAACEGFPALGLVVRDRGSAMGLLRSERRLQTLADARALLADPTTPAELVALLEGARLGADHADSTEVDSEP